MALRGEDVQIVEKGLVIQAACPWLGASPDGIVFVGGVPQRLLEVKCPYQLKDGKSLDDYIRSKSSCLKKEDGSISLRKSHSYFYQVQVQMFVCDLKECDFVVWSPEWLFVQRINIEDVLLKSVLTKLSAFYFDHLLVSLAAEQGTTHSA